MTKIFPETDPFLKQHAEIDPDKVTDSPSRLKKIMHNLGVPEKTNEKVAAWVENFKLRIQKALNTKIF
ncbi:hypothetical protein AUJ78_01675 [Candidatus Peregrinibacteria bacterium CG1_02_41_10]|nr:MAG: hypothetical protein AUJ78_01675 [Candidatus Peregrinibacteria bacterium CG1_02_41_10]